MKKIFLFLLLFNGFVFAENECSHWNNYIIDTENRSKHTSALLWGGCSYDPSKQESCIWTRETPSLTYNDDDHSLSGVSYSPWECTTEVDDKNKLYCEYYKENVTITCKKALCEESDILFVDDNISMYSPPISVSENLTCQSDENTTSSKEFGRIDCEDLQRCKFTPNEKNLDRDGDGYNDDVDAFPDDPKEWIDSDHDGVGNNGDTDDDNDGYSDNQENREGTDPIDPNDNGGTNGTDTKPDGGGSHSGHDGGSSDGSSCGPGLKSCNGHCILNSVYCEDYNNDNDCAPGQVPAPDYATTGNCLDAGYTDDSDCPHPPTLFTYPFRGISPDSNECYDLRQTYAQGDGADQLCPDGTRVACYYPIYNDDNSSSGGNNNNNNDDDTNATLGNHDPDVADSNNSDSMDDSAIVSNLIKIDNSIHKNTADIVKSISDMSTNVNDTLNKNNRNMINSLSDLSSSVNSASSKNHTDLLNINGNLNNMKSSLNSINSNVVSGTNAVNNMNDNLGKKLDDIKDKLDSDLTDEKDELNSQGDQAQSLLSDALSSFDTSKNDFLSLANGAVAPTHFYGGSLVLSGSVLGHSVTFDFSVISVLRPYLQFILNLFLIILTVRIYIAIARDIASNFNS